MGKASTAKRLRREQGGQQPPRQKWCGDCLKMLHDHTVEGVARSIVLEYLDMRSGYELDRPYSHAETMKYLESAIGEAMHALSCAGERYRYELDLEGKALAGGEAVADGKEPPEWTDQEMRDYRDMIERAGGRMNQSTEQLLTDA